MAIEYPRGCPSVCPECKHCVCFKDVCRNCGAKVKKRPKEREPRCPSESWDQLLGQAPGGARHPLMELVTCIEPCHRPVPPLWVGDPTMPLAVSSALWISQSRGESGPQPRFSSYKFNLPPES